MAKNNVLPLVAVAGLAAFALLRNQGGGEKVGGTSVNTLRELFQIERVLGGTNTTVITEAVKGSFSQLSDTVEGAVDAVTGGDLLEKGKGAFAKIVPQNLSLPNLPDFVPSLPSFPELKTPDFGLGSGVRGAGLGAGVIGGFGILAGLPIIATVVAGAVLGFTSAVIGENLPGSARNNPGNKPGARIVDFFKGGTNFKTPNVFEPVKNVFSGGGGGGGRSAGKIPGPNFSTASGAVFVPPPVFKKLFTPIPSGFSFGGGRASGKSGFTGSF